MTGRHWQVDVDRVVVSGGPASGLEAEELRALVERAVAAGLAEVPLPPGRTARSGVRVRSGPLSGSPAVAGAVAAGIAAAVDGQVSDG